MKEVMNCYTEIEMNERKGKWMKRKGNIKTKSCMDWYMNGEFYWMKDRMYEWKNLWMNEKGEKGRKRWRWIKKRVNKYK